jgi:hypothetical protein
MGWEEETYLKHGSGLEETQEKTRQSELDEDSNVDEQSKETGGGVD